MTPEAEFHPRILRLDAKRRIDGHLNDAQKHLNGLRKAFTDIGVQKPSLDRCVRDALEGCGKELSKLGPTAARIVVRTFGCDNVEWYFVKSGDEVAWATAKQMARENDNFVATTGLSAPW